MEKKEVDIGYFKYIDSPERAYWLGFLFADGCLHKGSNKVSICLNKQDISHLKKFRKALRSTHKISEYSIFDKRTKKNYDHCQIQISNKAFRKNLEKFLTENKSIHSILPDLSDELFGHFLRGLWDGDGTLYILNDSIRIGIGANLELLNKIIERMSLLQIFVRKPECHGGNFYCGPITKYLEVCKFFDFIYRGSDSSIRLNRKFKKFSESLPKFKEKIRNGKLNQSRPKPKITFEIFENKSSLGVFLGAKECAERIGVKPETIFSYMCRKSENNTFKVRDYLIKFYT